MSSTQQVTGGEEQFSGPLAGKGLIPIPLAQRTWGPYVMFSLYFVLWLTLEKGAPEIFYSLAFGISTFFIAMLAPILGAIADVKKCHRLFLIFFTLLSISFLI